MFLDEGTQKPVIARKEFILMITTVSAVVGAFLYDYIVAKKLS